MKPPLLDNENYSYWKARMRIYIQSLDDVAWSTVVKEWKLPVTEAGELKDEEQWSTAEKKLSMGNTRALNAMHGCVNRAKFRLIQNCTTAKKAWDILQNSLEGTSSARKMKLHQLVSQYDALRMNEEESLGEEFTEKQITRKMMRTAHRRFRAKLGAIEVALNYETMSSDELVGMLQAEEMALLNDKKVRGIALKATKTEVESESEKSDEDELSALTRKMAKILQQMQAKQNEKKNPNQKGSSSNVRTMDRQSKDNQRMKREARVKSDPSDFKGVRCYECDGYGHVRAECANLKKKEQKAFQSTWSDDEQDPHDDESDVIAFVTTVLPGNPETISNSLSETNVIDDDEQEVIVDMDKLVSMYHKVRANYKAADAENKRLGIWINKMEKQIDVSADLITTLNKEIDDLEAKCENLTVEKNSVISLSKQNDDMLTSLKEQVAYEKKLREISVAQCRRMIFKTAELQLKIDKQEEVVKRLNAGKAQLSDVLSMGKTAGDHSGLGFQSLLGECSNSAPTRKFLSGGFLTDHPNTDSGKETVQAAKRVPRPPLNCTYCGLTGHTHDRCLKLGRDVIQGKPSVWPNEEIKQKIKFRRIWVRKDSKPDLKCDDVTLSSVKLNKEGTKWDLKNVADEKTNITNALNGSGLEKSKGDIGLCSLN